MGYSGDSELALLSYDGDFESTLWAVVKGKREGGVASAIL
jgi:hypothetical protein